MKIKVVISTSIICLLALSGYALSDTHSAADCTRDSVNTAITAAVAGDIVSIPACPSGQSWTTGISWTAPANVTLQGAGTSALGGGDQTVIVDDYDAQDTPLLDITISATGTFRMTGITFKGGTGDHRNNGTVRFQGPATGPSSLRIDHCHFDTRDYSTTNDQRQQKVFYIYADRMYGVADNNIFDLVGVSAPYILNGGGPTATDFAGNLVWSQATNFGSADFFFMEDNQFNGYIDDQSDYATRVSDGWLGARQVVRFNNLYDCAGPEQHATAQNNSRGFRAMELYGNKSTASEAALVSAKGPNRRLGGAYSGPQLVWGNEAIGTYKYIMLFNVVRSDNETYTINATPNGWGYCGTDFNGVGSNWDGNTVAGTGYPCLDGPGRGIGDLITGVFPSKINSTTGTIAWPNQALEPVYIWSNNASVASLHGVSWYLDESNTATGYRLTENVDYYKQASGIQTNETTPFNGTTGTGWGTLANRPTTCTAGTETGGGVGYWATDQGSWNISASNPYGVQQNGADGVLYKCTSTDTWTSYYTPYTYPHPLRTSSARKQSLSGGSLRGGAMR